MKSLSCVRLFATPWTVAYQALLFMGFSRQSFWSRLPFPSQQIFPTQGSNPCLLHCRQMLYHLSHQGSPLYYIIKHILLNIIFKVFYPKKYTSNDRNLGVSIQSDVFFPLTNPNSYFNYLFSGGMNVYVVLGGGK